MRGTGKLHGMARVAMEVVVEGGQRRGCSVAAVYPGAGSCPAVALCQLTSVTSHAACATIWPPCMAACSSSSSSTREGPCTSPLVLVS